MTTLLQIIIALEAARAAQGPLGAMHLYVKALRRLTDRPLLLVTQQEVQ